jgi:hypothetical protein
MAQPELEKTEFEFPDEVEAKGKSEAASTEIEIVDDTPEADRNRRPMADPPKELTDEEMSKYDDSVKSRIKHFTKGYHEERRAKETANREREEAVRLAHLVVEENKKLRGSLSEGHTALLGQAKQVVAKELDDAKRKYKEAADAFDSDAMLTTQEELTNAKIKADKLENFRPTPLQQNETEVQIQQRTPAAPKLDSKLTSWTTKNTWFGKNKRMTAYALGVHEDLVNEGVPVGSDEYYEKIDTDLQTRFPESFEAIGNDAKPRRQSNVVAPATRSTAARKVVLTQSQVNIAKRLGVPLELYARKVAEGMR